MTVDTAMPLLRAEEIPAAELRTGDFIVRREGGSRFDLSKVVDVKRSADRTRMLGPDGDWEGVDQVHGWAGGSGFSYDPGKLLLVYRVAAAWNGKAP